MHGHLISINVGKIRGVPKHPVGEGVLTPDWGLKGDAHGGDWDRQISLFPLETMALVPKALRATFEDNAFSENLTVEGLPPEILRVGTVLKIGEAKIKILQIGKETFEPPESGRPYIVSREGRFGRVLTEGHIKPGDIVEIVEEGAYEPDAPKLALITLSDKGSRGEREDISGRFLLWYATRMGGQVLFSDVIPDDKPVIKERLLKGIEAGGDLILTTGGTGLSPRDVTPDVTREVIDREVPGFAEAMRAESLKKTPHAMISRAVSGVAGKTLIINLPGSPKAVAECMEVIFPALRHAIDKLRGDPTECATEL